MTKVGQKNLEEEDEVKVGQKKSRVRGGWWRACEKSGIKWDRNQAHQLCQLSGDPEVKKTPRD